ncbi:MAG: retroviral-like aspartic protease, partial [Gammaproteobacteria bacterium]|nr:retroviral-like aspartic protease [Gammaproteobacteria bacterium]
PSIKRLVDIEGFRVNAVLDSGSDINLVSAKCFKSFAMAQNRAKFLPKFHPVDRKFFTYNRGEIGHLKVWVPLLIEFEGRSALVSVVVDEDPNCNSDCILGSLGMAMLSFQLNTPSGVNVLLPSGAEQQVCRVRQQFPAADLWVSRVSGGAARAPDLVEAVQPPDSMEAAQARDSVEAARFTPFQAQEDRRVLPTTTLVAGSANPWNCQ